MSDLFEKRKCGLPGVERSRKAWTSWVERICVKFGRWNRTSSVVGVTVDGMRWRDLEIPLQVLFNAM